MDHVTHLTVTTRIAWGATVRRWLWLGVVGTMLCSGLAQAKPHKQSAKANRAAEERFLLACIDERTGPADAGGLELDDAEQLCRGIVKHQKRITKLAKLAAKARAAGIGRLSKRAEWECAEEVSVACEDTTERSTDGGECSDKTLEALHAFDVCRGLAPIQPEGK
jgi:hypothetical protein